MTAVRSNTRSRQAPGKRQRIDAEILVVEDQKSLALSLAKALHDRWGCKVLIATTLEQVRQIIAQQRHFFLAISDLNLPDSRGGEVIDALIAAGYPTIAVTGAFDEKFHATILRKGVIDYVLKNSVKAYEYLVKLVGRLYRNTTTKVLLVDDDPLIAPILTRMLARQLLKVVTAKDGEEAQQLFEKDRDIRLVFVDYQMPTVNGIELVATLRNKFSMEELPIIGISASDDSLLISQFLKVGANDFIAKPFNYDELVCRVSNTLEMQDKVSLIRHVAYHDYLTDLLNRRAFFERGWELHDRAVGNNKPISVAVMDIDHFKKVNDTHGHDGGDAVLVHFAKLLADHFGNDFVGRLGGEEFALIIDGEEGRARERCETYCERVARTPATFNDKTIPLTVSIGLTHVPGENLDASIKKADENLYQAKSAGRNRVVAT